MRYQKPVVMDLGAGARFAAGQGPLSCMGGIEPMDEGVCGVGTTPTWNALCLPGPIAGDCASGSDAGYTCLSGFVTGNNLECAFGQGGAAGSCTQGPSFV